MNSHLEQLCRDLWVPCYRYALKKPSRLMWFFIWMYLARVDSQRWYYILLLRPSRWKCKRCGHTFIRQRGWSTTTHEYDECPAMPRL